MAEDVRRLRRVLSLFETLLKRERNALAELHREEHEASQRQQNAVELLNSDDALALGISTLLISSSIASARRAEAIKSQFATATSDILRRGRQIDSLKRRIREAEERLERSRQIRGD